MNRGTNTVTSCLPPFAIVNIYQSQDDSKQTCTREGDTIADLRARLALALGEVNKQTRRAEEAEKREQEAMRALTMKVSEAGQREEQ